MEKISFKSQGLLPGVILDKQSGIFQIFGKSCPVDPSIFFEPVFIWFEQYMKNPLKITNLDFNLSYFNTASSKVILSLMTKMEQLKDSGFDIKIRWFYNDGDDDIKEAGMEFGNIVSLEFEYILLGNNTNESNKDYFDDFMVDII